MRLFRSLCLGLATSTAAAQGVTLMEFEPQATMLAPKGVLTACGIAFDGIRHIPGTASDIEQVSGSIAIYTDGLVLVKVGHQVGYLKNGKVDIQLPGTQIAWIRIEGQSPLVPPQGQLVPGEKPPFLLFPAKPEDAADAIFAMQEGKTIWVGFSKAGTVRHIFSGKVKIDLAVNSQIRTCFAEWSKTQTPGKK